MTRVHIFCEGQTEETFVRELLQDYFQRINIFVNPIVIRTSKTGKGGVSTYGKIKGQVIRKCREDQTAWVTTMLDFYGLPTDFPDLLSAKAETDLHTKAQLLEQSFQEDIGEDNFIANVVFHEFEGLLYSQPEAFNEWFGVDKHLLLEKEKSSVATPEHINDNPQTAPSKRLKGHFQSYEKVLHGSLIAMDIGLDTMRKECHLFDNWLQELEKLKV